MLWIRSLLFNIIFYFLTVMICVVLVPALPLPRIITLKSVTFYLHLVLLAEKYVLGLDLEIRGLEYLPKSGSYLAAAKHQSEYETLKLFHLFGDPAIIVKKELMRIPLWGWHAWKLDFIAIDRKNRESALNSIVAGARHVKEQGRPIVIFPQGTRTRVHETSRNKPYKSGIAKMYTATNLPIVPLAMNSGMFWPKNSFVKYPGKVVFEFLPPIPPGLPEKEVMREIEQRIESASLRLMHEAKNEFPILKDTEIPPLA